MPPKTALYASFAIHLPMLANNASAQSAAPRQRVSFNADWRFSKDEIADDKTIGSKIENWRWKVGNDLALMTENTAGNSWKEANASDDVFGQKPGFAWFRATLPNISFDAKTPMLLKFSGVDDNATVYLNGQKIGSHQGWGQPFEVAVNAAWKNNQPNEIAVLVENNAGAGGIGDVSLQVDVLPLAAKSKFDDANWRTLDLPHDWSIEGPFQQELQGETGKLPWAGVGWYRKNFAVAASAKDRRFMLEIDGAMSDSTVWPPSV